MRNKVTVSRIALLCAMLGIPAFAFAGTTGTEFLALYTWINGVVTGYLGRAIAMASVAIGALMSVANQTRFPFLWVSVCDFPAIHANDHHRHGRDDLRKHYE